MLTYTSEREQQRTANSSYPKVAVQWLNQALCFYLVCAWLTVCIVLKKVYSLID